MKDIGEAESYIQRILESFRMKSCKPIDTPLAKGEKLSLKTCSKTQNIKDGILYSSTIGSLILAILCTHPDIFHAV